MPQEVLGTARLAGVLVVDRYAGYNQAPARSSTAMPTCCATWPTSGKSSRTSRKWPRSPAPSCRSWPRPCTCLASRSPIPRTRAGCRAQSADCGHDQAPTHHLGVRHIQDLFHEHPDRLYHWAEDRQVPADNNRSERELRPLVIARKVSFGSQSDAGAHTREVLMSVLHTLRKRRPDPQAHFKRVLDQLATRPTQDPFPVLFPAFDSS